MNQCISPIAPIQWSVLLVTALCVAGCGPDHGRLEPHPVSGQVLINGEPAAACTVVFVPVDPDLKGQVMPGGNTLEDGSFQLTTHETGDGAPVGEYGVTLHWAAKTWPTMEAEMRRDGDPVKPVGPDRLQGAFSSPDKSGVTVTIEAGENNLPPFRLDNVKLLRGTEPETAK